MAREGKTRFDAYIDNIIAIPFKEALEKDKENFKNYTDWLENAQKKYTNQKKFIEKK